MNISIPITNTTNPPALFPQNPSNTSAWTFPPPVSTTFLRYWVDWFFSPNGPGSSNPSRQPPSNAPGAGQNGQQSYYFEVEATKSGMGGHAGGFGSAEKVVRVGDVVELGWDGGNVGAAGEKDGWREKLGNGTREERVVRLRCSVCSLGVKDGQSVGDACENYSDSSHLSSFMDITPSHANPPAYPYTIPPLSKTLILPDEAVGLCYFALSDAYGGTTWDFTIPFPVAQRSRAADGQAAWRWSKDVPSGVADASIGKVVATANPEVPAKGAGLDKGAIGGIVLGVLVGISLSIGVGWMVWMRGRGRWKRKSEPGGEGGGGEEVAGVELRRRRGRGPVVRCVETERDEDGEVPPPYHEVVKSDDIRV